MRISKYRNKKIVVDNIKFDSIAESDFYIMVKRDQSIKIVELQPKIYMTRARILYKPDFKLSENGKIYYVDVKGLKTPVFNLKARLWRHYGDGILKLVRRQNKGFKIEKIIESLENSALD